MRFVTPHPLRNVVLNMSDLLVFNLLHLVVMSVIERLIDYLLFLLVNGFDDNQCG